MSLSDELRRVAAVGTSQIEGLPQTIAAFDEFVDKFAGRREAVVLLKAAQLALRRMAGYIAAVDQRPLDAPCRLDECQSFSEQAAHYLVRMLEYADYTPMLPEWCLQAAILRLRANEELLPAILNFGENREQFRSYLGLLLGVRGMWLVQAVNNPDWGWALEVDTSDPSAPMRVERGRETAIIHALNTQTIDMTAYNQHTGLTQLVSYRTLWSKVLGQVFLNAVDYADVTSSLSPGPALASVLDLCGYYFPLSHAHSLLNLLSRGGDAWHVRVNRLREQFEMRQRALESLYAGERQPL